jgi:hypothetical protein
MGYYEIVLSYDDCVDRYLIFGESINDVKERIKERFKDSLFEYEVISINKSDIIGVL